MHFQHADLLSPPPQQAVPRCLCEPPLGTRVYKQGSKAPATETGTSPSPPACTKTLQSRSFSMWAPLSLLPRQKAFRCLCKSPLSTCESNQGKRPWQQKLGLPSPHLPTHRHNSPEASACRPLWAHISDRWPPGASVSLFWACTDPTKCTRPQQQAVDCQAPQLNLPSMQAS